MAGSKEQKSEFMNQWEAKARELSNKTGIEQVVVSQMMRWGATLAIDLYDKCSDKK